MQAHLLVFPLVSSCYQLVLLQNDLTIFILLFKHHLLILDLGRLPRWKLLFIILKVFFELFTMGFFLLYLSVMEWLRCLFIFCYYLVLQFFVCLFKTNPRGFSFINLLQNFVSCLVPETLCFLLLVLLLLKLLLPINTWNMIPLTPLDRVKLFISFYIIEHLKIQWRQRFDTRQHESLLSWHWTLEGRFARLGWKLLVRN